MSAPAPFDLEETDVEAVDELCAAWQYRCVATGCASGPTTSEAPRPRSPASAPPRAPARVRGTLGGRLRTVSGRRRTGQVAARRREFDEAVASWRTLFGAAVLVVEQPVIVRRLLTGTIEGERLGRLVDRHMLVATWAATDELQRAAFSGRSPAARTAGRSNGTSSASSPAVPAPSSTCASSRRTSTG